MDHCDITIVGAGPSGCACALALQGSGLRIVMIDKAVFPRDKVCGDAIPGPAFKAMDRIRPEWGQQMRQFADKTDIHTSKIFAPNGKTFALDWISYAYNSKRLDFDQFLVQLVRSDTETEIVNKHLTNISEEKDGLRCHFRDGSFLKTDLIIGCDGANSIVKRQLGKSVGADKPGAIAVRAYFWGVEDVKAGTNEFHFFNELPGYFWIFPLPGGYTNIGFGVSKKRSRKTPVNLPDSLQKIITTFPSIAPRFKQANHMEKTKGFALPVWSGKGAISGNRFMLCGDAASLVDPLQGHGIDKAMWSGLLAAKQAIRCFELHDFTARHLSEYDQQVYQKMGAELSRSFWMMRTFLKFPWIINTVVRIGQSQKLIQWAVRKLKI